MRVLFLPRRFFPWVGGIEKLTHHLAIKMKQRGLDIKIVTGWWFRGTPHREVIEGIPVIRIFSFWEMFQLKGLRKFGAYIYMLFLFGYLVQHRQEYDIIHCFAINYHAFVAGLAAKLLGKKLVVAGMCSGSFGDIRRMQINESIPGQRLMLPTIGQNCDCAVTLNDEMTQEMLAAGFPLEKIRQIPDGVEINGIPVKSDYSFRDRVILTFVGRLHFQKGPDLTIRGLARLVETCPAVNWQLLIVGDGPMRPELEELVEQLGLSTQIRFCGTVDDLSEYWAGTDIYIHSSRGDGMSLALLAALASALPVVATRIGGNVAVITDQENGLLTEPNSEDDLARAILQLFGDEAFRARLGQEARRTVCSKFSSDSIVDKYVELYKDLLFERG